MRAQHRLEDRRRSARCSRPACRRASRASTASGSSGSRRRASRRRDRRDAARDSVAHRLAVGARQRRAIGFRSRRSSGRPAPRRIRARPRCRSRRASAPARWRRTPPSRAGRRCRGCSSARAPRRVPQCGIGRGGIELGRALERADRRFVVEAERLRHPLVEISLRFRVRRPNRMMVLTERSAALAMRLPLRRRCCGSRCGASGTQMPRQQAQRGE